LAKNEKIQGNNLMKIEKIQGKMTGGSLCDDSDACQEQRVFFHLQG